MASLVVIEMNAMLLGVCPFRDEFITAPDE
jgi:hypothetical protein